MNRLHIGEIQRQRETESTNTSDTCCGRAVERILRSPVYLPGQVNKELSWLLLLFPRQYTNTSCTHMRAYLLYVWSSAIERAVWWSVGYREWVLSRPMPMDKLGAVYSSAPPNSWIPSHSVGNRLWFMEFFHRSIARNDTFRGKTKDVNEGKQRTW